MNNKIEFNLFDTFYLEYSSICIYMLISLLLTCILLLISYLVSLKNTDFEKASAYECGFDSLDDARKTFDIHFYIVGVLFLIFDLEIAFLFPWALCLNSIGYFGFFVMMAFLALLTIGFAFEWSKGALDWSDNLDV